MSDRNLIGINEDQVKETIEAYKKFAFKGDMLKMAVAFVLGGSFNKVVGSISANLIMPLIDFMILKTGANWREFKWQPFDGLEFEIGKFIGVSIDFVLISIVLFLLWRFIRGSISPDEKPIPLTKRVKDFVLSGWFYPVAILLALILSVTFGSWWVGLWTLVTLTMVVSWANNRELRRQHTKHEEDMEEQKKKIEENIQ